MWLGTLIIAVCSFFQATGLELARGPYVARVENKTLKSLFQLQQTVDLSGVGLEIIENNAFYGLGAIKNLSLANNKFEKLTPSIFSEMKSLETLSLADNKIRLLDESFVGLTNLHSLNLSQNLISTLKKADLRDLPKSVEIIMEGNPLKEITLDPSEDLGQPQYKNPDPWNELVVYGEELEPIKESNFKRTSYWYALDFQTLNLANHSITEITSEMFDELPEFVMFANLQHNTIETINTDVIHNKFLKKLILDYNVITTIEWGAFQETNLLSISLKHNRLKNLDFAETLPTSIQELLLEGNEISNIPGNSLDNLSELKHLVMPSNRIVHLSANMFAGFRKLRVIDLSDNLLETIEPGTFKHQEELSVLTLSGNKIKELKPGSFEGLSKLYNLELQRNAIGRIQKGSFLGLENSLMDKVILSSNEIDTIEAGSFANMTIDTLLLNANKISVKSIEKGAFDSCTLSWLSIQSNSLTRINGDSFYGILVYRGIRLAFNSIRSINTGAAKHMGGVQSLDLKQNPVERIENGSLFGFRDGPNAKIFLDHGVKVIEGGVFDNV